MKKLFYALVVFLCMLILSACEASADTGDGKNGGSGQPNKNEKTVNLNLPKIPEFTIGMTSFSIFDEDGELEISLNGTDFVSSDEILELIPSTKYTVYIRYSETEKYFASESVSLSFTTLGKTPQKAPPKIAAEEINVYSFTIKTEIGIEYRLENGEWQKEPLFENLAAGTAYKVYARFSETEDKAAGEETYAVITTLKNRTEKPEIKKGAVYSENSRIYLALENGLEWSLDGKSYLKTPSTDILNAGEKITVYIRTAETAENYASAPAETEIKVSWFAGEGTALSPYEIKSAEQFFKINFYLGGCFILKNDLDFQAGFTPIGASADGNKAFFGSFDGQGHALKNISLNFKEANMTCGVFVGLKDSRISNLVIQNINFVSNNSEHISAVCGYAQNSALENIEIINAGNYFKSAYGRYQSENTVSRIFIDVIDDKTVLKNCVFRVS